MRAMVDAVFYTHSAGVCHRDISLENFMLGGHGNSLPMLIDFGLGVVMEPNGAAQDGEQIWKDIPATGPVGKLYYMAPEIFGSNSRSAPYRGPAADVWSLGVCLCIMLTGVPPWEQPNTLDGRFRAIVMDGRLMQLLAQWKLPVRGVAAGLRLTWRAPWMQVSPAAADLMQKIFVLDPARRLTLRWG
jgi:serine/threonine protein kinase